MKETVYTLPPNGDDNKGDGYLAAGWVLVATAALSTAIRVIARARLTRNLGWDDFWIVVTMISNLVGLGFVTTEVLRDGLGRHMYYLTAEQRKDFTILGWLDWMQTFITIMFCKISICMFLLRIKNTRVNQTFMYILIALNVILTTVICGLFIGICSPPAAYWTIGLDGVCFSTERVMAFILAQGIFSAISDIVLATTPLLFLKDLHITPRTKLALCILMGAGYITAAASIVRTALSGEVLEKDLTYAIIPNAAWRATEVNMGIVCANAPIARPLYLFYRGRLTSRAKPSQPTPGSYTKSSSRLWPGSKPMRKMPYDGAKLADPQASGATDTSAEMGLPIQGYMTHDGKRESAWIELKEGNASN